MAFRGPVATIPAGLGTLNASKNITEVPVTDLLEMQGVLNDQGAWRKEPGSTTYGTISGTPAILAGIEWRPTSAIKKLVLAAGDGKLYKELTGDIDSVTLKSGLSTTARGRFVTGGAEATGNNKKLFYFNGVDNVQVLAADGATTADMTAPAADWSTTKPTNGWNYGNRLWACAGHSIYASSPTNHEDFACAQAEFWPLYTGIGDNVVTGTTHKNQLFVFKYPVGIYWLDDADVRPTYWKWNEVTDALGVANSPYAVCALPDDLMFLSPSSGFHLLSRVSPGETSRSNILEEMHLTDWARTNLNLARLNQAVSVWDDDRSLAIWAVPKTGDTTNTARLYFDFREYKATGRIGFSYSYRDDNNALFLKRDSNAIDRPFFGSSAGLVASLTDSTRNKDGVGYLGQYRTAETDFGFLDASLAHRKKNFAWLEVEFNALGACTMTYEILIDGTVTETLSLSANQRRIRSKIAGSGYFFSLRGKNQVLNQDFSVAAHRVGFTPGTETA